MNKFEQPIYVTKAFLPPIKEYYEKLKIIWDSKLLTNNGPIHNELELQLEKYLKVKNSVLFTNGHLALYTAIKMLNLKGEIITTPFTFASTTHAIVENNLNPIFCDINMNNFTIDVDKIESLITEKTSAIIPVHVFGYPCNTKEIEKIASKYKLKVIYDAAHVFGVEVDNIGIGNFGDVSMFSLHATKVYNSIEGGLLTFGDENLRNELNNYKNFGITGYETVESVGINAKMNEFQAAMGLINLNYINEEINKRKIITNIYRANLKDINGIYTVDDQPNIKHNYAYFPILIDDKKLGITRDYLYEKLKEYNVFARKYFYPLTPDFECYKGLYNKSNLQNAVYVADRILTLPIYGELDNKDVVKITQIIKEIIKKS
ncbi:DegT/DnrJ/EryC1/StrS family aminotransferase [Romboutsia maritimum]|uniref:DegT/DnrJ/EryC1/StrS family aminotransferase n=1 Tax=Romboutsia maritimum TaxID=2020948 RepID=A0A371IRQ6_9FIRM|nr:DegT/DnrJ/EryC1/StrS family aminotransferase [Romboutsia maritimum]RDY23168.1 DegT/DnrJ/EryC1/StrS family aminotransferase [Romboutsia maritimum]